MMTEFIAYLLGAIGLASMVSVLLWIFSMKPVVIREYIEPETTVDWAKNREVRQLCRRLNAHGIECTPQQVWEWMVDNYGDEVSAFGYVNTCLASTNHFALLLSYFPNPLVLDV